LDINQVVINNYAIAGSDDDGIHIASYLGDVDGDQNYTSNDTATIASVATGNQSGFDAFQNADPNLIGDLDGDFNVTSNDTFTSAALAVGDSDSTPQIPALPDIAGSVPTGGPDPLILLPKGLSVSPGAAVSVPIGFKQTNGSPIVLHSADLVIGYDASQFTVEGVRAGSLLSGGILNWTADSKTGLIYISISVGKFAGQTLAPNATGTLAWLDLRAKVGATGSSALNLRADGEVAGSNRTTRLNEGALTLAPTPTDASDDAVDGSVAISASAVPVAPINLLDAALAQYASPVDWIALPAATESIATPKPVREKKLGLIVLN
jgi:hypothetical protein